MKRPSVKKITLKRLDESQLPLPVADDHPEWIHIHKLAWKLAHRHIRYRKGLTAPYFMDEACMTDRVWQWDTCFMALYTSYAHTIFPGIESLDNFYGWQRKDGFIGMTYFLRNGKLVYGERCNPPLFAWAEWEYFRITGDDSRFQRVLSHLVRYFDWLKMNRRRGPIRHPDLEKSPELKKTVGGLYWETCAGAIGVDNSPRATHLSWSGGELAWVDFTSQQALAAKHIARIAEQIGNKKLNHRFESEYRVIVQHINRWMWCPKSCFYHDIFLDGNWLTVKTSAGFWPLLAGVPDAERAALLTGHLLNPNEFWRYHPVPLLSADDPNYDPTGKYCLGGIWSPTNTAVIRGLDQCGHGNVAHLIARRHLERMAEIEAAVTPHTLWECYAPDLPQPGTDKCGEKFSKPDFCGWTAMGATTLFYENVIGIQPDAPKRQISWDIRLTERHGFRRFPFLGHSISLICEKRLSQESPALVTIRSPTSFNMIIRAGNHVAQVVIHANQEHHLRV